MKTIFVVDDSISVLAEAEAILEKHYVVVTLQSAESMFTVLEKVSPDMILLDILLLGMSGLEALKALKESEEYKDIPVIFLTGLTDPNTEALGIELGITDFIHKPFSEAILLNRVRNYLDLLN
ncbi:MAG: response regulator [Lachnospiraceae bacterium]|nr:response regulator [Lachnospiraceae bacterium]